MPDSTSLRDVLDAHYASSSPRTAREGEGPDPTLLQALAEQGIRTAGQLVLSDISLDPPSKSNRSSSGVAPRDVFLDTLNACLRLHRAKHKQDDSRENVQELIETFQARLLNLLEQCAAHFGTDEPISGVQALRAEEASVASNVGAHSDALQLPSSISQLLIDGVSDSHRDTQHLCAPNEVVQIAGITGSGRKTLVINSLLRSLAVNEERRALWIGVPVNSRSSNPSESQILKAEDKVRHAVALKSLRIWDAIKAGERDESDSQNTPLDRLVIETCASTDAVLALLSVLLDKHDSQFKVIVIDQLHKLYYDEKTLDTHPGMTKDTVLSDIQRLVRQLIDRAHRHGLRVYLINGGMASLPFNPLSSFAATTNRPNLGNVLSHAVDATFWLSQGDTIFPRASLSRSTSEASIDGGLDGSNKRARLQHVDKQERLAEALRAQGHGMKTVVLEVLESSRIGKGRWTTYSSDGIRIVDPPPLV